MIVTASLNGMTLPSWASHVEDKLAPMPLLRVQALRSAWGTPEAHRHRVLESL